MYKYLIVDVVNNSVYTVVKPDQDDYDRLGPEYYILRITETGVVHRMLSPGKWVLV